VSYVYLRCSALSELRRYHMRPSRQPNRECRSDVKALQWMIIFPCACEYAADDNPHYRHHNYVRVGVHHRHVMFSRDAISLNSQCAAHTVHKSIPTPLVHFRSLVEKCIKMPDYRSRKNAHDKREEDHSDQYYNQDGADGLLACHRGAVRRGSVLLSGQHSALLFYRQWRLGCGHFYWPHFLKMFHPGKGCLFEITEILVPCTPICQVAC
jgi:hypothetical protein